MGDGRGRHRAAARLVAGVLALLVIAGCTVDGSAVVAPYRSPPLDQLSATAISTDVAGVLALAPSGGVVAVRDAVHGVCLKSVGVGSVGVGSAGANPVGVCADLHLDAKLPVTAAFSPDGQLVAIGQDVSARGNGTVWLADVRTGRARPVSPISGSSVVPSTRSTLPPASTAPVSTYLAMVWNSSSGHLLLIANSINPSGPTTRVVDVDPASLIPRVVALATGPYEFQSGRMATGGSKVIFTVYQGDQGAPNLVEVDLATGVRKEFGPLGPNGTQVVPLAVSPDGRQAVLGSSGGADAQPPRLLDLASGTLTEVPALSGNFTMASYSPNGTQIGLLSRSVTTVTVVIAPRSAVRGRALSTVRSDIALGSTLTWSKLDVLSISGPAATRPGGPVGWHLSTH